jgi:hypothetical protein
LSYSGGFWSYVQTPANQILTLAEVAQQGREPNFFELLQAGIAVGSLGKAAGDGSSQVSGMDSNTYYQIAQIAANLTDQYDEDAFPTRIVFGGQEFSGVENLPYLTRVFSTPYRYPRPTPTTYSKKVGIWYQPEIWNPSAEALTPSGNGPSNFRFIARGKAHATIGGDFGGQGIMLSSVPSNEFNNPTGITFSTLNQTFSEPVMLSPTVGAAAQPGSKDEVKDGLTTVLIGIWIGDIESDQRWLHGGATLPNFYRAISAPDPAIDFELQYQQDGNWITYDRIRNMTKSMDTYVNGPAWIDYLYFLKPVLQVYMIRSDPRSDRFGVGISSDTYLGTVRSTASSGWQAWGLKPAAGWTLGTYSTDASIFSGLLSDNKSTTSSRYEDPDGVLRPAIGAYTTGAVPSGYPMVPTNYDSRPKTLNRPFRSVAEMGYASRGMPWKDIDFFHNTSADAALLDLFCINPSPSTVAGHIDLNTDQIPVLEAILSGAIKADEANTVISDGDAATLAQNLHSLAHGTGGPLQNRADLVSRWVGTLPTASANDIIKRRREAPIRALSDVGNLRTWNLMIDVIAQSGRYLKSAENINQFTVEGERRYWLHVAIDRYTGKVVSRQLEPVFD